MVTLASLVKEAEAFLEQHAVDPVELYRTGGVDALTDEQLLAASGYSIDAHRQALAHHRFATLPTTVAGLDLLGSYLIATAELDARRIVDGDLDDWPVRDELVYDEAQHRFVRARKPVHHARLTGLQGRWLRYMHKELDPVPAWYFAQLVRVNEPLLTALLGIAPEDLAAPKPPAPAAPPAEAAPEPAALPSPESATIILAEGVELILASQPDPTPAPPPPPDYAPRYTRQPVPPVVEVSDPEPPADPAPGSSTPGLRLPVGWHLVQAWTEREPTRVFIRPPHDHPQADYGIYACGPGKYTVDGQLHLLH